MAEYIGSAQFGQPINFSAQKDGERYPSWINTDYSGLFDAIGESISGVISAKKEAEKKEKEEKKTNNKLRADLYEKHLMQVPEVVPHSDYLIEETNKFNKKLVGMIDGQIQKGEDYFDPTQLNDIYKEKNRIIAESNLIKANQQAYDKIVAEATNKEAKIDYDMEAFKKWQDGFNQAWDSYAYGSEEDDRQLLKGAAAQAKYLVENTNPLVKLVTEKDAFDEVVNVKTLGELSQIENNQKFSGFKPEAVEQIINTLESDPNSNVAKFLAKSQNKEEAKASLKSNILKITSSQEEIQKTLLGRGGTKGADKDKEKENTIVPGQIQQADKSKIEDNPDKKKAQGPAVYLGGKKTPISVVDVNGQTYDSFEPVGGFFLMEGGNVYVKGRAKAEEGKDIEVVIDYGTNKDRMDAEKYPDMFSAFGSNDNSNGGAARFNYKERK
jgi:hypothetical protein